jgi:hypothetical protein
LSSVFVAVGRLDILEMNESRMTQKICNSVF